MLTGDNPVVTARICQQVGIDCGEILTGEAIAAMSDAALVTAAESRILRAAAWSFSVTH